MDLKSGYPFWPIRNGLMHAFPPLEADLSCDVAIVGGGITAALIARELSAHGHDVAVLERRDFGWGSTSASTAMLQYEIDTHLVDLAKRHGEAPALLAYRACAAAIDELAEAAREVGRVDFARRPSLYYVSRPRDQARVLEEFRLRQRHGFPVEWLGAGDVRARYGFDAPGAILTPLAASVDPYRFALRLFQALSQRGVHVHDRSTVEQVHGGPRGVRLQLQNGAVVRARHVVYAAGYESQRWLPGRVAKNRSSYAYITDPVDPALLGELARTLVWESARPYLYLRPTGDGRLIVGGADDAIDIPARRDRRVKSKAAKLKRQLEALRPDIVVEPAFAWGGTFAETEDGLPFFGPHPACGPRQLFAMAYGGNGISYSMSGAALLRAWIEGRKHPLRDIYGFSRLS
jgi:glycine/D-amino acid oxidase-like deaminating enzyme